MSVYVFECDGVVMDESNDYKVVAYPYPHTYKHNDNQYWKAQRKFTNNFLTYEYLDGLQGTYSPAHTSLYFVLAVLYMCIHSGV